MASLFLIRHAEPEITGVFLGTRDCGLSVSGRRQAGGLSHLEPAVVYCSPLRRAVETAEHIRCSKTLALPELTEIGQGDWTGKSWAEIEATWAVEAARKSADWLGVTPPNGEPWHKVVARALAAWNIVRSGPAPAAIVGHQGINSALDFVIRGADPLQFRQGYGEVIRIEHD